MELVEFSVQILTENFHLSIKTDREFVWGTLCITHVFICRSIDNNFAAIIYRVRRIIINVRSDVNTTL